MNKYKKIRQQNNLTQRQWGELLGVYSHTVSRWENDKSEPELQFKILMVMEPRDIRNAIVRAKRLKLI